MEITHELKALKTRLSRLQEVFNSLPINPPGPEEWYINFFILSVLSEKNYIGRSGWKSLMPCLVNSLAWNVNCLLVGIYLKNFLLNL